MNRQRNLNEIPPANELDPEQVLTSWITAVACFHLNYNRVNNFVNAHEEAEINLGQCSINELRNLLGSMQQQLEVLLMDIEPAIQPSTQVNYPKLFAHANTLELLNRQAQKMLVLATLPAS